MEINSKNFWNELTEKNKLKASFLVSGNYSAMTDSEKIFELYKEGARGVNETISEYYNEIKPNAYVETYFDNIVENDEEAMLKWQEEYSRK